MRYSEFDKDIATLLDQEYVKAEDITVSEKVEITKQEELWLTESVLALPEKIQFVLYAIYEFDLLYGDIESLYNIEHAMGIDKYYRILFSESLNIESGCVISDSNMKNAIHAAMIELCKTPEDSKKTKVVIGYFTFVLKRVAVFLLVAILGLGLAIGINPEVRASVIIFIMEIYEEFTDFEFINNSENTRNADEYEVQYMLEGYVLESRIEEKEYLIEYYINDSGQYVEVLINTQDSKLSADTEGSDVHETKLNGYKAYTWNKENVNYITYSDENALIIVSGSISIESLEDIAKKIE